MTMQPIPLPEGTVILCRDANGVFWTNNNFGDAGSLFYALPFTAFLARETKIENAEKLLDEAAKWVGYDDSGFMGCRGKDASNLLARIEAHKKGLLNLSLVEQKNRQIGHGPVCDTSLLKDEND